MLRIYTRKVSTTSYIPRICRAENIHQKQSSVKFPIAANSSVHNCESERNNDLTTDF